LDIQEDIEEDNARLIKFVKRSLTQIPQLSVFFKHMDFVMDRRVLSQEAIRNVSSKQLAELRIIRDRILNGEILIRAADKNLGLVIVQRRILEELEQKYVERYLKEVNIMIISERIRH
jgi:hypothetical protein